MDTLSDYHAGRVLVLHGPAPLARPVMVAVCRERGVRLLEDRSIRSPGLYFGPPKRVIVHRPAAPAWIIAHELFHDILHSTERELLENFPPVTDEEEACDLFATLLCGKSPILKARPPQPKNVTVPRPELLHFYDPTPDILHLLTTWAAERDRERQHGRR